MSGWFVRIDERESYHERIMQLHNPSITFPEYTKILCVKHNGGTNENPHYHLVIETQVKDKAFRKRMVTRFDKGKGNGHMSIKPWDGNEEALSYMFHEPQAPIILNKGHTDADITRYINMNAKIQTLVTEAKGRASYLLEAQVLEDKSITKDSTPLEIARCIVLTAMRSDKYCPNDYILKLLTDRIRFKKQDGNVSGEEYIADDIARRALRL